MRARPWVVVAGGIIHSADIAGSRSSGLDSQLAVDKPRGTAADATATVPRPAAAGHRIARP